MFRGFNLTKFTPDAKYFDRENGNQLFYYPKNYPRFRLPDPSVARLFSNQCGSKCNNEAIIGRAGPPKNPPIPRPPPVHIMNIAYILFTDL